eukprot:SAG22_NODE_990_length_6131_cov_3.233588_3_plen_406_part_00
MWDQLIFIGGDAAWTGVAASVATRMQELRPAFRRKFGSGPRAAISVQLRAEQGSSCLVQHDEASEKLAGGPLRAAVWTEQIPGNATAVCASIVVINTALTATYAFTGNISGIPALANNPAASFPMRAERMFEHGAALNLSQTGQLTADYIGPGATHVYRVGCGNTAAAPLPINSTELAMPLLTVLSGAAVPGSKWLARPSLLPPSNETNDFAHAIYDPRLAIFTDTAIAVSPARHSLRWNLPSSGGEKQPTIIDFPGKQLVPLGPYGKEIHWDPEPQDMTKTGDKVVGNCLTVPGGSAFKVTLQLQAQPCGVSVTLMGGHWQVTNVVDREGAVDATGIYSGQPLAPAVMPCGNDWTTLEAVITPPAATTAVNGTALQLKFAVPESARGWGGSVWLGSASVTPMAS